MDLVATEMLRAVLENPADDLPRLALADYIAEHGTDADRLRAEFIQTQIAIHRETPRYCLDTDNPHTEGAHTSSDNPLVRHAYELFSELTYHVKSFIGTRTGLAAAVWRRGFIHTAQPGEFVFSSVMDRAFQRHPVEVVRLNRRAFRLQLTGFVVNEMAFSRDGPLHNELHQLGLFSQRFRTQEEAQRDASRVLVGIFRRRAGLPPLTYPVESAK